MHWLLDSPDGFEWVLLCGVAFLFLLFFLPFWVALITGNPRKWLYLGLNVLVGWTVMGWLFLVALAVSGERGWGHDLLD